MCFPPKRSGEEKNEEKRDPPPRDSRGSTVLVPKDNCMGTVIRRSAVFPPASSDFSFGASGCLTASLPESTALPPPFPSLNRRLPRTAAHRCVGEGSSFAGRTHGAGPLVLTSYQRWPFLTNPPAHQPSVLCRVLADLASVLILSQCSVRVHPDGPAGSLSV